jgi:hypothetical protein
VRGAVERAGELRQVERPGGAVEDPDRAQEERRGDEVQRHVLDRRFELRRLAA